MPALYLQGGSIIPVSPPYQHVGEANSTDDLLLLVALDEAGNLISFPSGNVVRSIVNDLSLLDLSLITHLLSICSINFQGEVLLSYVTQLFA